MQVLIQLAISALIVFIYTFFQKEGAYGSMPQGACNLALIPVIATGLRLIKVKDLQTGVFFVVIYETWNMFLSPFLWEDRIVAFHRVIRDEHIPLIAVFSALSVWALYFGFLSFVHRRKTVKSFFKEEKVSQKTLTIYTAVAVIGGVGISMLEFILSQVGIVISFLDMLDTMLPTAVLCLFSLYYIRGGRNIFLIVLIAAYLIYNFIYFIGGTLFIYSILLLMAPLAVYVVEKKKIPVVATVVIAVLLLPIYLSRHEYRSEGLYSTGAERMAIGLAILENEYVNFDQDRNLKRLTESEEESNINNRFEGVSYLATVVHCHLDLDYPYNYGKTFVWLPTLVIPRFMLPMRPSQNMGTEWAEYYQIKDKSWKASINFPMLVEFFADFGWLGMVVLSFFQGWLLAYVCAKFNNGRGDINLLFLLFVMPKLFIVEANITLAYGLILQVFFLIWIYQKFIRKRR